jgi:AraC family transcriptional regulator of adaptative response/methylated-DNA-[protein]-cysteine methyltransferase
MHPRHNQHVSAYSHPLKLTGAPSSLGWTLLGSVDRAAGIAVVVLADTPEDAEAVLAQDYPHLRHEPCEAPWLQDWLQRTIARIEDPRMSWQPPLAPGGTAWQQRVWALLQTIPVGQTLSYGEVARQLGAPGAARAVARACARNPVAVLVPCHRIVASDGRLSGYRWGLARKQALLQREALAAQGR